MADPRIWKRLARNPAAVIPAVLVIFVVSACLFGPAFLSASLGEPGPNQYAPPSWAHPFGTDLNGRGLWDAADEEFLEPVCQFRRNYEVAVTPTRHNA